MLLVIIEKYDILPDTVFFGLNMSDHRRWEAMPEFPLSGKYPCFVPAIFGDETGQELLPAFHKNRLNAAGIQESEQLVQYAA